MLNSDIFRFRIIFEEWPSQHVSETEVIKPYNGSLFDLRLRYNEIFFEQEFQLEGDEDQSHERNDSQKYYKIMYTINLLPSAAMTI